MVEICGWLIWKCICVLFNCMLMIGKVILILNNPIFTVLLSLLALRCAYAVVFHFLIIIFYFLSIWCVVLIDPVSLHLRFCFARKMGLCWGIIYYCMNLISLNLGFKLFCVCPAWLLEKIKDESTQKSVIYLVTYFWYLKNTKPCYN